jgi:serine protease
MRRAVTVAVLLLLPSLATAATTDRYLVALERGVPAVRGTAFLRDIDNEAAPRERRVVGFRSVAGFAADLTAEEASKLRRTSGVRYVEPVVERRILSADLSPVENAKWNLNGQNVPAGLDVVRARDVWPVTRGEGVNVAVVDTGVDYNHADLAPVYISGYNALTRTNDPMDDNSHGTHVAGTIAAVDNNFGVVGVAPAVRLFGVKVLGADGRGGSDNVAMGIDWVIEQKKNRGGNWIINMSLGSSELSDFEREVIDRALAAGILIVAASGNDSTSTVARPVSYPAAYPGVIAVGALSTTGQLASFSNQGPELAAVAPGVDVVSTVRVGGSKIAAIENGTSTFLGSALEGSKNGTLSGRFVLCGIGKEGEFPASVAGRIAVIHRGELTFAEKTRRAKEAGATAVVIVNNVAGPITNTLTLIDPEDPATQSFD